MRSKMILGGPAEHVMMSKYLLLRRRRASLKEEPLAFQHMTHASEHVTRLRHSSLTTDSQHRPRNHGHSKHKYHGSHPQSSSTILIVHNILIMYCKKYSSLSLSRDSATIASIHTHNYHLHLLVSCGGTRPPASCQNNTDNDCTAWQIIGCIFSAIRKE